MILDTGTVLNNIYRVVKLLGKGAMGNVYLVEKIEDDSKFVVKELIFSPDTDSALTKEIFFREAEFMAKFNHPGLPKMYGTFSQNDRDYIIMEYIEGETLEEIINTSKNPLSPRMSMTFILELAEILDYLHNSFHTPVIYRDLKPSNIIRPPEGALKLVDFGIARYYNPDKDTDTFSYGSPGYAAPEQYRGKGQTTPQTDIFALGVILYQLITKYDPSLKPFVFPPMKSFRPFLEDKIEHIVRKAIEIDPRKRYISIKDFKEVMEKYLKIYKPPPSSSQEEKPLSLYQTIINTIITTGIIIFFMFFPVIGLALFTGNIVTGHPVEGLYFAVVEIICSILIIAYLSYRAGAGIPHYIEYVMLNLILAVIFAVIGFSYYRIKQNSHLNGCKTNLKNMVSSLELYAQDNKGYYPPSLDRILVKSGTFKPMMAKIPLCPARYNWDNKMYNKIRSADKSPHYLYTVSDKFDNFTLCCNTPNIHRRIKKGTRNDCWPQYSSKMGLLSGPGSQPVKLFR